MELDEAVKSTLKGKVNPVMFRPIVKSINNRRLKIELDALCRNGDRLVIELLATGHINN